MSAKIATGIVESPFGVSLRDKLTKALTAAGYDSAKVKRVTRYPRVVRWKVTPIGKKPQPFGIRIRNKRTGQQFVHEATGQGLSAGEMRIGTPVDMQTGDVLEIDHPAGCPSFPYAITFEYEGQQFQVVERRDTGGPSQTPLPKCAFSVVNVASVEDTINLVDYDTAMKWLFTVASLTAESVLSASASVSIDDGGASASVSISNAFMASAARDTSPSDRECEMDSHSSVRGQGEQDYIGIIDDEVTAALIASASNLLRTEIVGTVSEFRANGNVIGYSLPVFAEGLATGQVFDDGFGLDVPVSILSFREVRLVSGLRPSGTWAEQDLDIGGVPLKLLTASRDGTSVDEESEFYGRVQASVSSSLSVDITATFFELPAAPSAVNPSPVTIPPPPGWPV